MPTCPSAPARRFRQSTAGIGVLLFTIAGLAACASPGSSKSLATAERSYRAGDFEVAASEALAVEAASRGEPRAEAAYLAGLALAREGKLDDSADALRRAAASGDPDLAARAQAALGSVERARGHEAASTAAYRVAARGPDDRIASRADRLSGGGSSSSRTATTDLESGFTVQVGAFSTETAARKRAGEVASLARRAGFPSPQVRPITNARGRTLWAVQIGSYGDRRQAGAARERLGHPEWAVETLGGG